MKLEYTGYAPDLDPTTPNIITDCANWIPSIKGYEAAPSAQSVGLASLSSTCQGAAVLTQLDGTTRFLAGDGDSVFEGGTSTWTARATGFTLAATSRWRFGIQGNIEFAVAKEVNLIASDTSTLSAVSGAPKASIIETVGDFVFLFDYNDGTDTPDGWYCSALGDYTDWTTSVATQCANGRLYGTPGKITAGKRFADGIIAYKKHSMYIGLYVGPPVIWEWREIPGDTGALCQEVVVDIGTSEDPRHIFMGRDNFYLFDGVKPIPIGTPVKDTVFQEINRDKEAMSLALHDRLKSRVYFFYPVASTNMPEKCVVYNYRTNQWGRRDFDGGVQAAVEYISAGISYDDLGSSYATYDDLPNVSYDSAFLGGNAIVPAVFASTSVVKSLDAEAGTSSFTTGEIGDDTMFTMISRAKNRYLSPPTTAVCTNFYKNNIGDSFTQDSMTSESSSRFDFYREARWHKLRFDFTGDVRLPSTVVDLEVSGDE